MRKAFVIDDDPSNLDVLRMILEHEGWQVYSFANASHVVADIELLKPELIILDVLLRSEDGRAVCELIRNTSSISNVYIYLTSTNDPYYNYKRPIYANGFLQKPFELDTVCAILRSFDHLCIFQ